MRADIKRLLNRFTTKGIKNGDLVVTFEIHRVSNMNWAKENYGPDTKRDQIGVKTIGPRGGASGERVMSLGHRHQQGVAKLKG